MKLYEIKAEYENLLSQAFEEAEEHEGVISDFLSDRLDSIGDQLEDKLHNTVLAYKNCIAEADAIKAEIKKLTARAKTCTGEAEWIKNYIARHAPEGQKFSWPDAVISWRKSVSVEVESALDLPEKYQRITVEANKTELKEALKSGLELSGVKLVAKMNMGVK